MPRPDSGVVGRSVCVMANPLDLAHPRLYGPRQGEATVRELRARSGPRVAFHREESGGADHPHPKRAVFGCFEDPAAEYRLQGYVTGGRKGGPVAALHGQFGLGNGTTHAARVDPREKGNGDGIVNARARKARGATQSGARLTTGGSVSPDLVKSGPLAGTVPQRVKPTRWAETSDKLTPKNGGKAHRRRMRKLNGE